MADPSENYKVALANVEAMLKKQEALNKSADKLKNSWNAISSQIFGLDGASFFKQVPLSVEDIKELNNSLQKVNEEVKVKEEVKEELKEEVKEELKEVPLKEETKDVIPVIKSDSESKSDSEPEPEKRHWLLSFFNRFWK